MFSFNNNNNNNNNNKLFTIRWPKPDHKIQKKKKKLKRAKFAWVILVGKVLGNL